MPIKPLLAFINIYNKIKTQLRRAAFLFVVSLLSDYGTGAPTGIPGRKVVQAGGGRESIAFVP
jgi:hypothetical protein